MTERRQLPRRRSGRRARRGRPGVAAGQHDTLPAGAPVLAPPEEPTLLGLPAEPADDPVVGPGSPAGHPVADDHLVVLRRTDALAGSLLLVAGAAGGLSLFLPWLRHGGELGLALVLAAADVAGSGLRSLVGSGLVLPLGVAVSGGALFLLGLLAFRPARTHRGTGTVALSVVLAVASGVVVRMAEAGAAAVLTDPGGVCAVLVVALGALGALKAMLTVPEVTTDRGVTSDPG